MLSKSALFVVALFLAAAITFDSVKCKKQSNKYLLKKPGCTIQRQKELEIEMNNAVPIGANSQRKFPLNMNEVHDFCNEITRLTDKAETFFKECYHKRVLDYIKIFVYSVRRHLKKHCESKKQTELIKEILKISPCGNKAIRPDPKALQCHQRFMDDTKQLVNVRDDTKKIPHLCCHFAERVKCMRKYMNSVSCVRDEVPKIREILTGEMTNVLSAVCGDYTDHTNECDKLGASPAPSKRNNKSYTSVVSLFIDILQSMD